MNSSSRSGARHAEASEPTKYRPIARLGSGGMADVFLAQASGLSGFSKLAVIKRPRDSEAIGEETRRMFLDEARLAARLNHPNVVNTFEVGTDVNGLFIAMEFLDGQALSRIVRHLDSKKIEFPLALRLQVLRDVLTALEYAHELCDYDRSALHIVHRDVSPQNVFVLYSGQAKLVDFGIAKATSTMSETRTGVLKGKLAYMAPEQARGEELDGRADLFSVGVMLWEALTRRRLWTGYNDIGVLKSLVDGTPIPSAASVVADLPKPLVEVCERALHIDRERRYGSAGELLSALEAAMTASGLTASSREVGKLVEQCFGSDRAQVMAQIEAFTAPTTVLDARSLPDLSAAVGTDVPEPETTPIDEPPRSAGRGSGVPSTGSAPSAQAPSPRRSGTSRLVAAVVAVLAAGSAAASYKVWRDAHEPPSASPNAVAIAPTAPSASASSVSASASLAAPSASVATDSGERVRIELAATPPQAKIFLDDLEVPNPYRTERASDAKPHTLRVTAAGFTTKVMPLSLAHDLSSDVALSPPPVFVAVAAPAPKPLLHPRPAAPPPPRPKLEPVAAAPVARPPGPGEALQPPARKPTVTLDTSNPW